MRPTIRYPILLLFLAVVFSTTGCSVDIGELMAEAQRGEATAQVNLGWMYEKGKGVDQSYQEAVYWYRKAAEQGLVLAQNKLQRMRRDGGAVEQDFKQAVYLYRKAAEKGDALGQNNLGWMYGNGYGVEQDFKKAVSWYRKAAEKGDALGQNNLGWMYEKGTGVEQSYQEAVSWYGKAAEQGLALAQNNLQRMHRSRYGVEQSDLEALQKNAREQNKLGEMYEKGKGVSQSDEQASRWYVKAAIQGNTNAQNNLQRMHRGRGRLTQQKAFSLVGVITKEPKAHQRPTKQRGSSNENMVATVRKYEESIRTILELGPISTPSLPPLQKYEQDVFESQEEFKARITKAKDVRTRQIEAIQRVYRKQVEARNQRVKDYDVKRDFYRNVAIALAVEELYGTPVLYPTIKAQGAPNYDAENKIFSMALVFSKGGAFKRNISSVFPDNPSAKGFYQKLDEGKTLPLQVNFQVDAKGNIELEQVAFDWQSATIASSAVKAITDNSSDKLTVMLGHRDQVRSMLQNPVIPDKEFDIWLAQEQKEFDDDIPQLLKRHKQARVDKRKWLFVIGAGKYKETSDILYSRRSAELFAEGCQ